MQMQKFKNYTSMQDGIRTTKTYDKPGKPIEWVRIHSLPDFVYFNHSQHVKVGQSAVPDLPWRNSKHE